MNGLLDDNPSPGAVRLVVGGSLLLFVQTSLLMLEPGIASHLRVVVSLVSFVSGASLMFALVGFPDPPPTDWRRRRGR